MRIELTYCAPCGYADQAVDVVAKILRRAEDDIESLTIVPGADGVFDLKIDGKLVFSKHKTGWFPKEGEVEALLG